MVLLSWRGAGLTRGSELGQSTEAQGAGGAAEFDPGGSFPSSNLPLLPPSPSSAPRLLIPT